MTLIPSLKERALLGVGTDILSIERIRGCLDSPSFMTKTFTDAEVALAASRADPARYYAKVFAGKEAVFKCFGLPADTLRSLTDIEVVDGEHQQPVVRLHGTLAAIAERRGVCEVLLSLSYDLDYAIAFAALAGKAGHNE